MSWDAFSYFLHFFSSSDAAATPVSGTCQQQHTACRIMRSPLTPTEGALLVSTGAARVQPRVHHREAREEPRLLVYL